MNGLGGGRDDDRPADAAVQGRPERGVGTGRRRLRPDVDAARVRDQAAVIQGEAAEVAWLDRQLALDEEPAQDQLTRVVDRGGGCATDRDVAAEVGEAARPSRRGP